MKYEIDVIGVDEDTTDADAICFRYYSEKHGRFLTFVYDGGTQEYGNALSEHLKKYYFPDGIGCIDCIICSHPDQDHASGLSVILREFDFNCLIMNRPWLYVDKILKLIDDGRMTKDSLEAHLKDDYPYIATLEEIAISKGKENCIYEGFQGCNISNQLKIMSPTKQFFIEQITATYNPSLLDKIKIHYKWDNITGFYCPVAKLYPQQQSPYETWTNELLRDDVTTEPSNETSIVLLGDMEEENFLLTGDAGIKGLSSAINYSRKMNINLKQVSLYQIPHHGSRHNISPAILNQLIGDIIPEGTMPKKTAFVSAGKNSDHPRKMAVNAFIRRGVKVYQTKGSSFLHNINMPTRSEYSFFEPLDFSRKVEAWDDQ
jgi:beta-lactamase superfamily II metal-dependent hydrolase